MNGQPKSDQAKLGVRLLGRCRWWLGVLAVISFGSLGGGCGATRSATAVCKVWDTQSATLLAKYKNDATHSAAGSLEDLVTAPSAAAGLMGNMAVVAPTPIESDLAALQSAFQRVAASNGDAVDSPMQALAKNVVTAVEVSGSVSRVDSYISANCVNG